MKIKGLISSLAVTAVAALTLAGCSAGDGGSNNAGSEEPQKDVKIAVFNGWDEGVAVSHLWKAVLEDNGYEVSLEYADPAPVYLGLTTDDYDLTLDTWLPITHSDYLETYGDNLVDLGAWNNDAVLTIAVNEDAPIDSLEELAANADLFKNEIVGIEAGAGLTRITTDEVIPTYGLEKMDYTISSTPAMLAELKAATAAGENVVVTLWRPHWAYNAFPIKDLKDPKGALGSSEGIHAIGGNNFETNLPEVAKWIKNFDMPSDLLYSLEDVMFNDYDGDDFEPIVRAWMDDNADFVSGLTK